MSAFLVNPKHAAWLAAMASTWGVLDGRKVPSNEKPMTAEDAAELLMQANIDNIEYRYATTYWAKRDSGASLKEARAKAAEYLALDEPVLSCKRTYGLACCLEYQSSDKPDYIDTVAYHIVLCVQREAAERYMMSVDSGWALETDELP